MRLEILDRTCTFRLDFESPRVEISNVEAVEVVLKMLLWYRCQAEELDSYVKACLQHREKGGLITDFSNLTKKVPLLGKDQISKVVFMLRRRIQPVVKSEAPVKSIIPEPSSELLIRLERIRLMERGHDVSLLDAALKRLVEKAEGLWEDCESAVSQ